MEPEARVDFLCEVHPKPSESCVRDLEAHAEDTTDFSQLEIDDAISWRERTGIRHPRLIHSMIRQLHRLQVAWGQEFEEDSIQIAIEAFDQFEPQGIYEAKLVARYAGLEVVGDALLCRAAGESESDACLDKAARVMRMSAEIREAIFRVKESRRQGTVVRHVRPSKKSIGR